LFYFLLAVFFTYKIASFLFSKKAGILAVILTILNPFFFTYAFEGRMYSILALGVTASMYFFIKSISVGGKGNRIGYIIATLWAIYSHHFAFFALVVQGLWFLSELAFGERDRAKKLIMSFIIIGILYLPWIYPLYTQTLMVKGGFWLGTPTLTDLRNLIYEYLAQGIKYEQIKIPFINIPLHEISLYLVFITLILRKWHKNIKSSLFLILWFFVPILATWGVSQKFQSIFFNRYLLYAIPGAMVILASGRRKYSLIPIVLLIVSFAITDYYYFTHPIKLPFRQIAQYVKENEKKGDYLINWNSSAHHLWETKYYGVPAPVYIPNDVDLPFFVGTALMEDGDIVHEIPTEVKRVGVFTSGSVDEIALPGYTEESVKEQGGLKFIWYVNNKLK
ncbi:MAG TPA: glycosyltransferase family 39 protein, partial [Patescibacteria group bacterium]|nr:glycosyltransferase family 39 protein [Patescibacteria group bacterium]